jgi:hypothetical protein
MEIILGDHLLIVSVILRHLLQITGIDFRNQVSVKWVGKLDILGEGRKDDVSGLSELGWDFFNDRKAHLGKELWELF